MFDIHAVHQVKALFLESVNAWKNYRNRMPLRSSRAVEVLKEQEQYRCNPTEKECTRKK